MNWARIKAVTVYSWYQLIHTLETWVDIFWFPLINLIVFGFIGGYLNQTGPEQLDQLLMGLFFWQLVSVSQYSVTIGMMWDVYYDSFSSVFVSPVSMKEFLAGHTLSGLIKSLAVFCLLALVSYLGFDFSIFSLGWVLPLYLALLLFFGFILGVFIAGIIFRYGKDMSSLSWGLIFIFQPISAIYYPVEALPANIRWLAYLSPITYLTEAGRSQLQTDQVNWQYLLWAFLIAGLYLIVTFFYTHRSHLRAREKGSFSTLDF